MDLETKLKKEHAKWIGLLAAFFIPGSAHYLSGHRKSGILLYCGTQLLPMVGICITAIPSPLAIYIGLAFIFILTPLLFLVILFKSYRPIKRLGPKQWGGFVLVLIGLELLTVLLSLLMPVKVYKLPTGAMEPTLMGIQTSDEIEKSSLLDRLLLGQHTEEIIARDSGEVSNPNFAPDGIVFDIGNTSHLLPNYLAPGTFEHHYNKGDVIWSGTVVEGDRIAADKWAYLFETPARGDIVTFSTKSLVHSAVRPDTVYIKRIVGLPGERIQIINSRLHVNGEMVDEPSVFQNLHYQNAGQLDSPEKMITLGPDEYLTMGDNTAPNMSLDGRYYGPIQADSIIAKVRTVYWPFNRVQIVE